MEIDGNTLAFIIIILFLFFSSPNGDGITSQYEYNQLQLLKDQYRYEYNMFNNMTCATNFKNITGLKLAYDDIAHSATRVNATYPIFGKDYEHWFANSSYTLIPDELIDFIRDDVWNVRQTGKLFPRNISSSLLGTIKLKDNNKYKMIPMPISKFYEDPEDFSTVNPPLGEHYFPEPSKFGELHNVTFKQGDLSINVVPMDYVSKYANGPKDIYYNSQSDKWKMLTLQIEFHDSKEREKHSFFSRAIYDIDNGRILSISQSAKLHSLFALPHYMNLVDDDDISFIAVKQLIQEYWNSSDYVETFTMADFQELKNGARNRCEYMIFLQLQSWNQYNEDELKLIDDELQWPSGRPANLTNLPLINITSGLVYSPDCGFTLTLSNVAGERYELKIISIRKHLLVGLALFVAQIYLFLSQMQYTNTPSKVNKISYYSFFMINIVDGSLATLYFVAANIFPELYLPLIISAFASFILASTLEIRYLITVYASQVNENNVGLRTLLRGSSDIEANEIQRTAVIPDESSISGSLYGRFFFMLIVFTFVTLNATTWPKDIRRIFEYVAIITLNSYWIPQIARNAVKGIPPRSIRQRNFREFTNNSRRHEGMPLLWSFIVGTTTIRCIPIIYVFTYSSNVFRHHRDPKFVVFLLFWMIFQMLMLYSQDILGSRWFLPQNAIPEGYSYFKPVSLQHLLEHTGGSDRYYGVDCAICMSECFVHLEEVPETHKIDIHDYMVTPCEHIFHTDCLENWMSYKLQCPICRAPLPPL